LCGNTDGFCNVAHTPLIKKRPNFFNSKPTSMESALRLLSTPSIGFWQQTTIYPISLWALVVKLYPLNWARAQAVCQTPNFLNSASTRTESAPSVRFWQQTAICPILLWAFVAELHPLNWARAQAVHQITNFALTWCILSFWVNIWWQDPMLMPTWSATSWTVKPDARCAQ
jgi:hypothetical protein